MVDVVIQNPPQNGGAACPTETTILADCVAPVHCNGTFAFFNCSEPCNDGSTQPEGYVQYTHHVTVQPVDGTFEEALPCFYADGQVVTSATPCGSPCACNGSWAYDSCSADCSSAEGFAAGSLNRTYTNRNASIDGCPLDGAVEEIECAAPCPMRCAGTWEHLDPGCNATCGPDAWAWSEFMLSTRASPGTTCHLDAQFGQQAFTSCDLPACPVPCVGLPQPAGAAGLLTVNPSWQCVSFVDGAAADGSPCSGGCMVGTAFPNTQATCSSGQWQYQDGCQGRRLLHRV